MSPPALLGARDFFNSETGTAEAGKAQVLGLDGLERPQGTLGLFIRNGLVERPIPRPEPTLHLAGMTDTLIADADGIYHPALFNEARGALYALFTVWVDDGKGADAAGRTQVSARGGCWRRPVH